ncbi:MAG TPA: cytochrome c [Bacteroidia bacterium]|nr:cytochrome c [Bacteroidia bacterium]
MNNPKLLSVLLLVFAFIIYTGIVYTVGTAKNNSVPLTDDVRQGKIIWQKKNCSACHQLYGLGGYMGPDLTNVISARGKGEIYAEAFIRAGTKVMPNFQFKDDEVKSLVAFLKYVDASGKFPMKDFGVTYYGTVQERNHNQ